MRLLTFLADRGEFPYAVQADADNSNYSNWLFKNTPRLEGLIEEYFDTLKSNNGDYCDKNITGKKHSVEAMALDANAI